MSAQRKPYAQQMLDMLSPDVRDRVLALVIPSDHETAIREDEQRTERLIAERQMLLSNPAMRFGGMR